MYKPLTIGLIGFAGSAILLALLFSGEPTKDSNKEELSFAQATSNLSPEENQQAVQKAFHSELKKQWDKKLLSQADDETPIEDADSFREKISSTITIFESPDNNTPDLLYEFSLNLAAEIPIALNEKKDTGYSSLTSLFQTWDAKMKIASPADFVKSLQRNNYSYNWEKLKLEDCTIRFSNFDTKEANNYNQHFPGMPSYWSHQMYSEETINSNPEWFKTPDHFAELKYQAIARDAESYKLFFYVGLYGDQLIVEAESQANFDHTSFFKPGSKHSGPQQLHDLGSLAPPNSR